MTDIDAKKEDNVVVCGVCLEEVEMERQTITKCSHTFCEDCIRNVLSRGHKACLCPMCRTQLVYGEVRMFNNGELVMSSRERTITASVSCVWRYGDEFVRRVGGHDQLTGDSWLAVNVNYFHVGATVDAVPPGQYVAAFRLKRLPQLKFREPLVIFLDGVEQRRVLLHHELDRVGVWQLLIVGTVDISNVSRSVSASMRAGYDLSESDTHIHPKGGLVIDCFVLFPPSNPPPAVVLTPDDSRAWIVTKPDCAEPLDFIQLRCGKWRDRSGHHYQLRSTDPVSFLWSDGTIQSLHTAIDNHLVWRTTSTDFPEIHWLPRRRHDLNHPASTADHNNNSALPTAESRGGNSLQSFLVFVPHRPFYRRCICAIM